MSSTAARDEASIYDPKVALEFFKAAGKPEKVAEGRTIFAEKEKSIFSRNKVYLLLSGEVGLLAGKKPIGSVKAGEIFGELAAITHSPRSATAVAKSACAVIALDDREFQSGLRKKPAFALMLMSMLVRRLRETIRSLEAAGDIAPEAMAKESAAFDPKHLGELVKGLSDEPVVYFNSDRAIMQAGQAGVRMYVVTEGTVVVKIGEQVVERLGPGGVFGEAALVDQSTRLATAVAETDCALLPISRNAFLALVKMSPGFAESMLTSLARRLRFLTSRAKLVST
jgi:CRP/FNR family cyclic AMP-dependent transcriptional regulator